jgi:ASC-1-like (ASCH) protein
MPPHSIEGQRQPIQVPFRVPDRVFKAIETGLKKKEVRIAYPWFMEITVENEIVFTNPDDRTCSKKVRGVQTYNSMYELLEEIDPEELLPGATYEEVQEFWQKKTNSEDEKKYGIVVFEI